MLRSLRAFEGFMHRHLSSLKVFSDVQQPPRGRENFSFTALLQVFVIKRRVGKHTKVVERERDSVFVICLFPFPVAHSVGKKRNLHVERSSCGSFQTKEPISEISLLKI